MTSAPGIQTQVEKPSPKQASLWTRDFVLIALINFTTFFGFNMTTTGMPVYVATLGADSLTVGFVTSFATGAALFIRPFTGIMLDRFSRKGILMVGIAGMALVIAAYAVFPIVALVLTLRLVHGIGWGLSSTATSTIAADVIPRKRFAEGMGYFALTSSLAVAIAPALAIALIQGPGALPMIIIAASCTVLSLILAFFQKPHPSEEKKEKHEKKKLGFADFFDKMALLPAGIIFLITIAFASITTFIALHGQDQGVDNIFLYFIVYAIVTIISRPIVGKIIDRTGYFFPGIFAAIAVAITLVIIAFSDSILVFCVAGIFGGLGVGTGMGTLQAMAVSAVPSERRGVATSTYLFGLDAGIAVGATLAGILATTFGYSSMYLAMAVFPLIAGLIFIALGKKRIARYSISELSEVRP